MALTQCINLPSPTANIDRVKIGRALVDALSFSEAVEALVEHAASRKPATYVVTPNAQHVVLLEDDTQFREYYEHAGMVLADGVSLLVAAKVLGTKLKERVNGTNLFTSLCERAAQRGLRVYLLGSRPGIADLASDNLRARYPKLIVAGTCSPPEGFENQQELLEQVARKISQARPDILFVGLGAPKQESWMFQHGRDLDVPVSVGVGGSFDLVSGRLPRAPLWMQNCGLEWLFRLVVEPRRLWKRYLIGNTRFIAIVLAQLFAAGFGPEPVRSQSVRQI